MLIQTLLYDKEEVLANLTRAPTRIKETGEAVDRLPYKSLYYGFAFKELVTAAIEGQKTT